MRRSNRNAFSFPDFSLRRLLIQGARAARGSPPLGQRLCDVEKGSSKHDKKDAGSSGIGSNKGDSASHHSGTPPPNCQRSSVISPQRNGATSMSSASTSTQTGPGFCILGSSSIIECALCYNTGGPDEFYTMLACMHIACRGCLESYLIIEITESRTDIACPQCSEPMHPSDIQMLLSNHPLIVGKYEDFMVRRVLLSDPDSRWCPAPDCCYAVIASGCASCPRIKCERPGCDLNFCYHCKAEWHPDQTCDAARASRQSPTRVPSGSISQDSQHRDDIKPCPRCQVLIVKMDDGSCNHMVCAVCGSEFCWLCMKEISDLHYLSPSGCTFWGKKPWSRKKKLLWQLGTLVGAPVGIALVAGIAVPAMIIGIPVWVGRRIHSRQFTSRHKRNCAILGGVTASMLVSPVLAGLAVAIGVPILLFYVYGVVPVSLCRAGCGVSTTRDGFKFDFDEEEDNGSRNQDAASADAISRIGATSIGEVSLSVASGSHLGVSGQNPIIVAHTSASNRESTTALAGSITSHKLEVQADVIASETASAVTCVSEKSGLIVNDTMSTRALAGSILSYKQDTGASCDKASVCSGRSNTNSERLFVGDHPHLHHPHLFHHRVPKLGARAQSIESSSSLTNQIPENSVLNVSSSISTVAPPAPPSSASSTASFYQSDNNMPSTSVTINENTEVDHSAIEATALDSYYHQASTKIELNASHPNTLTKSSAASSGASNNNNNSMSKAAILRSLFFSQSQNGGANNSSSKS